MNKKQKNTLYRIIASAVLFIVLQFIELPPVVMLILYIFDYLIIGYDILRKAFKGIVHGNVLDENFLMAVASLGAFALAIVDGSMDCGEAVAVMLFYQIGELFQSVAIGKSRQSITALMDIRPDYANIEVGGELQQVDPDEVAIGTEIIVQPGEKVPIDGVVIEGSSTLNTSALTGESVPRDVTAGDDIISGCINLNGVLKIKTTKEFGESTVSMILELVEDAGYNKAKSEEFISKFARIYTPAVCASALVLAIIPPVIRLIIGVSPDWADWIYRALSFLVISCPCALVISIPLSFFAGIGGASREGILIKGANYLEALSKVRICVFDKTGTLTKGSFEVTEINSERLPVTELLRYAAYAECASSHPISRSLKTSYGEKIDRELVTSIEEISGHGITANVGGHRVAAGNIKLVRKLGLDVQEFETTGTIVYVAIDGVYEGNIVISDTLKETSAKAIKELKENGVSKTVMLTGDAEAVASYVAKSLGIDEYRSELLPAGKVLAVEEYISAEAVNEKLAFVGDGINDAPVLMRADIGIAMGALGSDAAIEAADVVLMDDNPMKIVTAIKRSRKCLRIVYQNIVFAIGVKLICLILSAFGIGTMWMAIFADVGVMIIAVLNSIRALGGE